MVAKISVIIPAYNAECFIERALASVEGQTCQPFEVVVVDDGSTDRTHLCIREFAKVSKLNLVVAQQKNQGSAAARNRGTSLSTGELLAFMDADDIMYPQFLEIAVDGLNRYPHWSACFSDRDIVDQDGKLLAKDLENPVFRSIRKEDKDQGFVELVDVALFSKMISGSVIPMTILLRREVLEAAGGFDQSIRFHEDRLLLLEIIKQGGRFGYYSDSLGIWQRHATNKTGAGNLVAGIESSDQILQKILASRERLRLSTRELLDVRAAQRQVAMQWLYALSRTRSAMTFSIGRKLWAERRISLGYFLKAVLRYSITPTRP